MITIGPYTIVGIETGHFALDGGAMFGVVPKTLWSKTNPADELNRITLASRSLLIRGNGRTILVDTGTGNKLPDKLKRIYGIEMSGSDLASSLARHGVHPGDVTDVILTHLHFDHAGGATIHNGVEVVPQFPNARYYVQAEHYRHARHPLDRDRASFFEDNFMPVIERGMMTLIDGAKELFPMIDLVVTNGHTPAQQLPRISDGKTTMIFCCDLIPTATHLPPAYVMGYDLYPVDTMNEKKNLIAQAYEEKWILHLQHDPGIPAITIGRGDKGFVVGEKMDDTK